MNPSRSSVTSWLEVIGLLLLVLAAAVEVGRFALPAGLATGGALLIVESAFLTWRARPVPQRGVDVE
jgi:hypothetical protein